MRINKFLICKVTCCGFATAPNKKVQLFIACERYEGFNIFTGRGNAVAADSGPIHSHCPLCGFVTTISTATHHCKEHTHPGSPLGLALHTPAFAH